MFPEASATSFANPNNPSSCETYYAAGSGQLLNDPRMWHLTHPTLTSTRIQMTWLFTELIEPRPDVAENVVLQLSFRGAPQVALTFQLMTASGVGWSSNTTCVADVRATGTATITAQTAPPTTTTTTTVTSTTTTTTAAPTATAAPLTSSTVAVSTTAPSQDGLSPSAIAGIVIGTLAAVGASW